MQKDGYSLLLPTGTLDYFDVVNVVEDSTQIVIYLEEKNIVPVEYSCKDTESKGFFEPKVVQDFPIRGKQVFLNVRHSINAQGITETYYNVVPAYGMLHIVYKLNIEPKKRK